MANLKKPSLRVNPNEDSEASEAHSSDPKNPKQTRGNVGARFRRTQTPPVRTNEAHFRKFRRNGNGQQPTQLVEHNSRALVERIQATTEVDVIVPPFDGWDEKNPIPGENYTEIFGKVVHGRRNYDSPYKLSQPRVQMKETKAKGCGCFGWIC